LRVASADSFAAFSSLRRRSRSAFALSALFFASAASFSKSAEVFFAAAGAGTRSGRRAASC
jgi:hypothetical protein